MLQISRDRVRIRAGVLAGTLALWGVLLSGCSAHAPTPAATLPAGFISMAPDHPAEKVGFRWTGARCPKVPHPVAGVTACAAAELYASDPCTQFEVEVTFRDGKGAATGAMDATAEHVRAGGISTLYFRYMPSGGSVTPSAAYCAVP